MCAIFRTKYIDHQVLATLCNSVEFSNQSYDTVDITVTGSISISGPSEAIQFVEAQKGKHQSIRINGILPLYIRCTQTVFHKYIFCLYLNNYVLCFVLYTHT